MIGSRVFPEVLFAHPRWLALALGALAACGFAPLHLWPLTLLAVAGLIELTARAANWKQAALTGWLFGLGHFALGINWIAKAFAYQDTMPAWLGWIAVLLLSLYLAVWPALALLAAWLVGRANRTALIPAFAACWIVAEWLRSWVFTGFPANPLGSVGLGPFSHPGIAALLPWLGTYGLSGLIALFAGGWLIALRRRRIDWRVAVLVALPVLLQLEPWGLYIPGAARGPAYTLVQPDIRQEILNDPRTYEDQFLRLATLSQPRGTERRLVLWPESGVPDFLHEGYPRGYYDNTFAGDPVLARKRIGQTIGPQALLLSGTVDLELRGGEAVGARNTVIAVDGAGAIRGGYAKAHLVPFGEYVPLRGLLEPLGLARLVPGSIEFWPGPGPRTLDFGPWGKVGPLVCYEIIFSGQVTDRAQRPDFLFNPYNDGWYGSWAPPQHLAQARMRAIEEGLPVLRSTTTGISAVIDRWGIVRQSVPRHMAGRLDGTIPPAGDPTPFSRLGNALPLGWAALLLALALVASRRRPG